MKLLRATGELDQVSEGKKTGETGKYRYQEEAKGGEGEEVDGWRKKMEGKMDRQGTVIRTER